MTMRISAFEIKEPLPELRSPHVVALLRPWIDAGSVGTLVLLRLEEHFKAQELGKLARPGAFFDFTRYRPTVTYAEEQRVFITPNTTINYAKRDTEPDLLFFHILEPHAFGEDYAEAIIEVFKALGVKRYCRVGGMYDAVPHTRPILVTGSLGGKSINLKTGEVRAPQAPYQGPTTILNMVSDGAEKLGIESMSLMAHLPQYMQLEEDYTGSTRLLEVLSELYNMPLEIADRERGRRQYQRINAEVERNPAAKALVAQLEADYDARTAPQREAQPSPPLSPEVERFLRDLNQRLDNPQNQ